MRVFEIGRVFRRDASVPDGAAHGGRRAPADARGRAGQRRGRRPAVGPQGAGRSTSSTSRATSRRCWRRAGRSSWPTRTRRCTRGAARASSSTAARIGHVGELHPQWRQAYELPQAPVLFELDLDAVLDAPVPVFTPVPRQQPAWRDVALVLRDEVGHDALMARAARRSGGPDPLGHAVRHLQARHAGGRHAAPASAAWRCGWNCSTPTPR